MTKHSGGEQGVGLTGNLDRMFLHYFSVKQLDVSFNHQPILEFMKRDVEPRALFA